MIKKAQKLTKVKVGVMIDLKGPVIRTCEFREKSSVRVIVLLMEIYIIGDVKSWARI
jgi:pyruvate kinase